MLQSSRCVVLGAGFSRAVSEAMPVTNALGALVLDRLSDTGVRTPNRAFAIGRFEAWLSRLAEPQPDLDPAENLHNQADFGAISEAVRDILVERQAMTMAVEPSPMLERFLRVAHAERLTIISFNYDTLLEAAVSGPVLIQNASQGQAIRVDQSDLLDGLPQLAQPHRSMFAETRTDIFRLLKLHGSIDCWWVSGDATGATIVRSPGGWRGGDADSYARMGAVPGRVPFLVPPAAGKSQFYQNPLTRELWQRAGAALQAARTVDLVGYSLPLTDLVTTGMFVDRLSRDVPVRVTNPSKEGPISSLRSLGLAAEAAHDNVESYVAELERLAAMRAVDALAELDDKLPLVVGTAQFNFARVVGCRRQGRGVMLDVEPFNGFTAATRSASDRGETPVTVAQLRHELVDGTQLTVELPASQEAVVIAWEDLHVETGFAPAWAVGKLSLSPNDAHRTS